MATSVPPLRVAVYIGWHRWCDWRRDDPDDADAVGDLLEALRRSRHTVCALILRRGDRLAPWARRLRAPLLPLPSVLCRPFPVLRREFGDGDHGRRPALRSWLAALEATRPDLGFVTLGGWIPPRVAAAPRLGFVNYHPAPLPEWPGLYPEVFLALRRRVSARGTFHRIAPAFDTGEVLAYTPAVRLSRRATARDICDALLRGAVPTLPRVLDRFAAGTPGRVRASRARPGDASTAAVNRESGIDWTRDGASILDARLRALACSRSEAYWPLHARVGGCERQVLGLEFHAGVFPGVPGQTVGRYRGEGAFRGAALVRAVGGLAVVAAGPPFRPGQRAKRPGAWLVRGGRRARRTRKRDFEFFAPPRGSDGVRP